MSSSDNLIELARLQRLLTAREGKAGYKENVVAIKQRIAAIENGQTPAVAEPDEPA